MCRVLSGIVSVFLIFGLITLPANAAPVTAPLGVVVAADQAKVGNNKALIGSTIFHGDLLVTEAAGQMQVRFDGTQARLLPGSVAVVNRLDSGVNAALLSGSMSMASPVGGTFSLSANGALVRPAASQAVAAQVTRVSPNELLLSSSKGALEVVFDGEVTTIDAGQQLSNAAGPGCGRTPRPRGHARGWPLEEARYLYRRGGGCRGDRYRDHSLAVIVFTGQPVRTLIGSFI